MESLLADIGNPLIAVIVPIVIYLMKQVLPKIPTAFLPILAGLLGPVFDYAIAYVGGLPPSSPVAAALYGLAGVGLREVKDQLGKAIANAPPPPKVLSIALALLLMGGGLMGCAGVTANTQTQLLLACQGFTRTELALRPFKPQMSESQVAIVRESINVAEPICTGDGDLTDVTGALDLVRAKLRELVTVQNQVKA